MIIEVITIIKKYLSRNLAGTVPLRSDLILFITSISILILGVRGMVIDPVETSFNYIIHFISVIFSLFIMYLIISDIIEDRKEKEKEKINY